MVNIITAILRSIVNSCCTIHIIPLKLMAVTCVPWIKTAPPWKQHRTFSSLYKNTAKCPLSVRQEELQDQAPL